VYIYEVAKLIIFGFKTTKLNQNLKALALCRHENPWIFYTVLFIAKRCRVLENNMSKESKEINEQIEYGIDKLPNNRFVSVNLKDLMLIYKSVEEFRRFFHNSNHYPLLSDVYTYMGNSKSGAYSILNKLYCKTIYKYLPEDINNPSEEEEKKFTHPNYPYYYNLKTEDKYKLTLSEKTEAPILNLIEEMGFEIYKKDNIWNAEDYNTEFRADTPSQLLGLISLYKAKGRNYLENNKFDDK